MINENILKKRLIEKFTTQLTDNVVTEAFVRGLPLSKNDISYEIDAYRDYVTSVLESLGGSYNLLEKAVYNTDSGFIHDLAIDVVSTAIEAANRIVTENKNEIQDPKNSMYSVIDKSEFTAEEINRFKKKGSNLSIKDIGKVINNKVIDTIKLEKSEYEDSEALKEKLSAALDEAKIKEDKDADNTKDPKNSSDEDLSTEPVGNVDDFSETEEKEPSEGEGNSAEELEEGAEEGLESLYKTVLTPFDVTRPISLFSRLQDLSLESVLCTCEAYSTLPFETLTKITIESTMEDLEPTNRSIEEELYSITLASESYRDLYPSDEDFRDKINTAMACAICMETMFETLNTLNLYTPSIETVRRFIDKPVTYASATEGKLSDIKNKLLDISSNYIKEANKIDDYHALESISDYIGDITERVNLLPPEYNSIKNDVCEAFESVNSLIVERYKDLNSRVETATESLYDLKNMENNIAQFDKIARTYGKHPNVTEIRVNFDVASENMGAVAVDILGKNGTKIDSTIAVINGSESYKTFKDCVLEAARCSQLPYTNKTINIYDKKSCKLSGLY